MSMLSLSKKCTLFLTFWLVNIILFHRSQAESQTQRLIRLGKQPDRIVSHNLPKEEWFIQQLDHFDPTNEKTWKQRYFTNATFYKDGGPVFLMIGGEGEASAEWMVEGQWIEDAQHFNALCFQLEHRFYGKSRPSNDLSVDNLKFLSSEQALADIAYFIKGMNKDYQLSHTKWIVHGGSYPGSLAAWMRLRYPHLVYGALSASGPLLAKLDFKEFFVVVHDALAEYSEKCVTSIQLAFQQVQLLLNHVIGQRSLNQLFRLCNPINVENPNDISNLFENLASNFAGVVQYNKDNRPRSLTQNITIDVVCNIMMNQSLGSPVDRMAAVNTLLLSATKQKCLDYVYENMITQLQNISWTSSLAEGGRQWTYQTCVEFGFFQTSSMTSKLFSSKFPVEFFIQQCTDIFGTNFTKQLLLKGIERTNTMYGELLNPASRVVYVHGSTDPWHALGITKTLQKYSPAIYIHDTAHCAVMYPSSSKDPPQLTTARKQVRHIVGTWLQEDFQ